jgi:hypothetical protein
MHVFRKADLPACLVDFLAQEIGHTGAVRSAVSIWLRQ